MRVQPWVSAESSAFAAWFGSFQQPARGELVQHVRGGSASSAQAHSGDADQGAADCTPNTGCNTGIAIAFKRAAIAAMLETAAFVTYIASCCHVNSCWMPTIYSMRHHSMTSVGNTESVTCQQPTVRVGEHVGRKERRYSQKML